MKKFVMAAVGGTLAGIVATTQLAGPLLAAMLGASVATPSPAPFVPSSVVLLAATLLWAMMTTDVYRAADTPVAFSARKAGTVTSMGAASRLALTAMAIVWT